MDGFFALRSRAPAVPNMYSANDNNNIRSHSSYPSHRVRLYKTATAEVYGRRPTKPICPAYYMRVRDSRRCFIAAGPQLSVSRALTLFRFNYYYYYYYDHRHNDII